MSVAASLLCFFSLCTNSADQQIQGHYLNHADTVSYVGMQTCRNCHEAIYQSYIKTGMGQSFHLATKEKSAADFNEKTVYDSIGNFYYRPFWKNDSMYMEEFRLEGSDTVFSRTEHISYIIGSGQHTNSHLCNFNGYIFQAPATFYTQQRKWDLAPGFEGGFNARFTRAIGFECMTCHNGLPQFEKTSLNKFSAVPVGIDCERCHGAGGAHVKLKQAGILVDTANQIDYSIVNPGKLSQELQMSLCQRCHLQGLAVLQEGKDFDDFKPGMHLSEVWNVFLPETDASKSKFIMASQAERLVKSKCYEDAELSCITCHNPHVSVKETVFDVFNSKCRNCHNDNGCSEKQEVRAAKNDNCSGCHMPKSGSIDIPHVFITDHFIRVPEKENEKDSLEIERVKQYLQLKCYTEKNPAPQLMAHAYLSFYEKFSARDYLLDSAAHYLFLKDVKPALNALIHYYFLRKDFARLLAEANKIPRESVSDAWTLYRIGEANYTLGYYQPAQDYFKAACAMQHFNMDFQNKLAATLTQLGKYAEAKKIYQFILAEQPRYESAWSNIGFLYLRENNFKLAETYFDKALSLNPDYELALINKASLYFYTKRNAEAKKLVKQVLKINPQNMQALQLFEQLSQF
ncbi:MAG: tetratricopeptide repeat protein [Chitinophagales bacterium]|nr:tetratricopeptide repeat protein [Chitinophagales bacterium]